MRKFFYKFHFRNAIIRLSSGFSTFQLKNEETSENKSKWKMAYKIFLLYIATVNLPILIPVNLYRLHANPIGEICKIWARRKTKSVGHFWMQFSISIELILLIKLKNYFVICSLKSVILEIRFESRCSILFGKVGATWFIPL